jgi:hypothetical protein
MKNYYTLLVLLFSFISNSQTNCDEANSYLVNAYSHVKDAYDSNNISHLKYYSNRSIESFKLSKKTLKTCNCEVALNLANKGIELLEKVEGVSTFEDGRFYVKRARDISKESVIEVDKCSIIDYSSEDVIKSDEYTELQKEKLNIKQQQEALKLEEEKIRLKLAQQNEKKLLINKKQLIISYENAISSNVNSYNETLKVCDCNHVLFNNKTSEDLTTLSIENIKAYYKNTIKTLATKYLKQLNLCNN